MFRRMRLLPRLLIAFISVALIPLLALGYVSIRRRAKRWAKKLSPSWAVRDNKQLQIDHYFRERSPMPKPCSQPVLPHRRGRAVERL